MQESHRRDSFRVPHPSRLDPATDWSAALHQVRVRQGQAQRCPQVDGSKRAAASSFVLEHAVD